MDGNLEQLQAPNWKLSRGVFSLSVWERRYSKKPFSVFSTDRRSQLERCKNWL